jgi:hypothetical protein
MHSQYNLRQNPRRSVKAMEGQESENLEYTLEELDKLKTLKNYQPTHTTIPSHPETQIISNEDQQLDTATGGEALPLTQTPLNQHKLPELPHALHTTLTTNTDTSATISVISTHQDIQHSVRLPQKQPTEFETVAQLIAQLSIKFDTVNTQIDAIQQQNNDLGTQLVTVKTEIDTRLGTLKNEIGTQIHTLETNLTQKINDNINSLESRMDDKLMKLEVKTMTHTAKLTNEILEQVNLKFEQQNTKLEARMQTLEEQLPTLIQTQTEQLFTKNNEKLEEYIDEQVHTVTKQLETHMKKQENFNEIINEHTLTLTQQNATLNQIEKDISKIKETPLSPQNINLSQLPEIIINYVGENATNQISKLPHFHPKNKNPPEFLEQFNRYYDNYAKRNTRDCLSYLELIENCFEGTAAMWYQIIKSEINDAEDFKTKFLRQYWSTETQRSLKHRIEFEKYRVDGNMTMTEYFIDRTITLKSMIPPLDNIEIIEILSNNFNEQIRASISVQNVQTFEHFIEILNREDMFNKTEKARQNSNNYRPNHHNTSKYHQHTNEQDRQGNYDKYNKFVPSRHHPYNNNSQQNQYNRSHYQNNRNYQNNSSPIYQNNRHTNSSYGNNSHNYQPRRNEREYRNISVMQVDQPHRNNNRYPTEDQSRYLQQMTPSRNGNNRPHTNSPEQNDPQPRSDSRNNHETTSSLSGN